MDMAGRRCFAHRRSVVLSLVTFIPPFLFWNDAEMIPDTSISYQLNDNEVQTFEFAIGGLIENTIIASISAMCMWVFWYFLVRDRVECDAGE